MKKLIAMVICSIFVLGCNQNTQQENSKSSSNITSTYFDQTGRDDLFAGGVKMIPISTDFGEFKVWTKRVGNNAKIKVLLLHGGPGATHEAFEVFDSYLPQAGIEYYYYDQLGSTYSDQPEDPRLLDVSRFVEEVEQVRLALGLNADNFYLLGHSWGGLLGIEYALKYQQQLKGLIISNMMASIPAYNDYAKNVIMPNLDQQALSKIKAFEAAKDYANPEYQGLLMNHHYVKHVLRMPFAQWPEPILRTKINYDVYIPMQGPSELGASGLLENWDRTADLKNIKIPTLVIGAEHDTMDPKHKQWMAKELPKGEYLHCANGSHFAMYDDQKTYMQGLIAFLHKTQ
ncbi:proline iminopeptidase-family hydrolase [Paraglaciecola aestuariivivens]